MLLKLLDSISKYWTDQVKYVITIKTNDNSVAASLGFDDVICMTHERMRNSHNRNWNPENYSFVKLEGLNLISIITIPRVYNYTRSQL